VSSNNIDTGQQPKNLTSKFFLEAIAWDLQMSTADANVPEMH
jgi:hypothetical protein